MKLKQKHLYILTIQKYNSIITPIYVIITRFKIPRNFHDLFSRVVIDRSPMQTSEII